MTYKLTNFFVICDETMTFTAWHTAELDSAPKNHTETIPKVLFLKMPTALYPGGYSHFFGPE